MQAYITLRANRVDKLCWRPLRKANRAMPTSGQEGGYDGARWRLGGRGSRTAPALVLRATSDIMSDRAVPGAT